MQTTCAFRWLLLIGLLLFPEEVCLGGDLEFSNSARGQSPPVNALGYPHRDDRFDPLPGFQNPPPGYGQVPFWWWTGDDLNVERMIHQVRDLHKKGISGVQVNYSHYDTPGWLTDQAEPRLFTDEWWNVYSKISEECARLGMGIGLSTYTIDWPRGAHNLFYQLFYHKPENNAIQIEIGVRQTARGGEILAIPCAPDQFAARAYRRIDGKPQRGGLDLAPYISEGIIQWTAPEGDWEIWTFCARRKPGSFNPLMEDSGQTIIRGFFQQFQDHNPGQSSQGLNYFFNDELHIGVDKYAWNPDFIEEFQQRKGYDLLDVLPGMWTDVGDATPKIRMDYADVRMSLMEERYFKPIYEWHVSRGMIFACDSGGRGRSPNEFGDYFRATRWYSAPGHDTPGGNADLIKGKVSSSIANLYGRPRVWLEGYHSLGWDATPERLMFATRENYLYGCTLLNLHGLYYTTYGSHWEWAPPCYHFRMPYWNHMDAFLQYFERLSFLMSQGSHACDVAIVYPVAPYEAEMNGNESCATAFQLAERLFAAGIDFEFIDNDSLARAEVIGNRLVVTAASASYQALLFPNMEAVRWQSIEKAAAFSEAGGVVAVVGSLPSASDRAGRNDARLEMMNEQAYPPSHRLKDSAQAVDLIRKSFTPDARGLDRTVRTLHRKIGPRDVYLVMDAQPGDTVEFRASGAVELWDPWTGAVQPLRVTRHTETGTQVALPLEPYEAQVVVFTPDKTYVNPPERKPQSLREIKLPDIWDVQFTPTMDNRYGDFRMPVTPENRVIGIEARRFAWKRETPDLANEGMSPALDDSGWETKLHGFGPQFLMLGPIPKEWDTHELEADLARLDRMGPSTSVTSGGQTLSWSAYDFSWRFGKEGDPGHQGYHGLKGVVTDDFLCLGKATGGLNETRYEEELPGGRYYLWTSAMASERLNAEILYSRNAPADKSHTSPVISPAVVYVNGQRLEDLSKPVTLKAGSNPTLIRYDHAGRGHFVFRRLVEPNPTERPALAMRWHEDPGVLPFDIDGGRRTAEWFRFLSAPGTSAIEVKAVGDVEAWIAGEPMRAAGDGRFEAVKPVETAAVVALRILPRAGFHGGAVIPEPIRIESIGGRMSLGDWSQMGILHNYSGGVRYRARLNLDEEQTTGKVILDLGQVVATTEVHVNGQPIGVRVAPPWRLDVTKALKKGENTFEALVYNTLSNHYQTIPSRYRGAPLSGLLGPVCLKIEGPEKE